MSIEILSNHDVLWPIPAAVNAVKNVFDLGEVALSSGMASPRNAMLFVMALYIVTAAGETTLVSGHYLPRTSGVVSAKPFVTLQNTAFGPRIEAASVDKFGKVFATDFRGAGYELKSIPKSFLGQLSDKISRVDQEEFFEDAAESTFNGLRFLPSLGASSIRALAADPTNHRVLEIQKSAFGSDLNAQVFCSDVEMVEPNDLAVAYAAGRIYLSGQNYTSDTVVGDGDLWMCEAPASFFNTVGSKISRPVKAIRLGIFGRTNGIEVSPDEKTLYLSEAFNKNGTVMSNKIWKFSVDSRTGLVSRKKLFVDFHLLDGTGNVDVDGMRVDVDGNLFVARNGGGQVLKFSPEGELLLRINLQGIRETTNLEFGGPWGTSLVVVGKCDDGSPFVQGKGCANIWHGNFVPGHAFHVLKYIRAY